MARAATEHGIAPGTILAGRFRVERTVGQGSMGIVHEGTELALGRRVAVKVLSPERANSDEARKRFLREARAASRLSSEHVTRMLDVGEFADGTPFLVMEFLVGANLEAQLVTNGPPTVDVAVDWVLQALEGVAEAHRLGLVHRDLKPENLFLAQRDGGRGPIVKVLDFGTVKDLASKATKLTRTGATMGSPAYMAPEQVRAEPVDARADVWAMGITLYELLTGRLPFLGDSVSQTLSAILRDAPVPVRERRPEVSPELAAVIERALAKPVAERYPSANELRAALAAVRARIPATTPVTQTMRLPDKPFSLERPDEFAETTDFHRLSAEARQDASQVRPRIVLREPAKETIADSVLLRSPIRTGLVLGASLGAAVIGVAGIVWHFTHRPADMPPTPPVVASAPVTSVALPPTGAPSAPPELPPTVLPTPPPTPVAPPSAAPTAHPPEPPLPLSVQALRASGAVPSHASRSTSARSAMAW